MVSAGFNYLSDLYGLYNVVQNTFIRMPKDAIIASLKEYFGKDSLYHYVSDEWGFPKTPDHTDLDPYAGIADDLTTRVYIGEFFRYDVIYYPAILVKGGGNRSVPISFNRDAHVVEYVSTKYVDGYGNEKIISTPSHFVFNGAWEGSINIDVITRGLRERDDLVALIGLFFVDLNWNEFFKMGISIKPTVSAGPPTETEDRNDKLFRQTITVEIRTEWRREIPILNFLDIISICTQIGNLQPNPPQTAPNLEINTKLDLLSALNAL